MWVVIVCKTKLISLMCIVRFGITSLQIMGLWGFGTLCYLSYKENHVLSQITRGDNDHDRKWERESHVGRDCAQN